jgi:hypothetical protein
MKKITARQRDLIEQVIKECEGKTYGDTTNGFGRDGKGWDISAFVGPWVETLNDEVNWDAPMGELVDLFWELNSDFIIEKEEEEK